MNKIVGKMIIANIDSTGLRIRVNISKFFITDYKKILFTTATIEELYYFAILCKTGYDDVADVYYDCKLLREHVKNTCMRFWVQRKSTEHKICKFFKI